MRKSILILVTIFFTAGFLVQPRLEAQISISKSVLSNGGVVINNGEFTMLGTVGQPFVGVVGNSTHVNRVGFWYLTDQKVATDVADDPNLSLPTEFGLDQNYPNPFNPETEIPFQLPQESDVVLKIFNIRGQLVRTLIQADYTPGFHSIRWDGKDNNGTSVSSGLYIYQFLAGEFVQVRKMTLLK